MKTETILNAMKFAQNRFIKGEILNHLDTYSAQHIDLHKLDRQYRAFRARILRMFEELEAEVESEQNWANHYFKLWEELGGRND